MKIIILILLYTNLFTQSLKKIDDDLFRLINDNQTKTNDFIFHNVDYTLYPAAIITPIVLFSNGFYKNDIELKKTAMLLSISEITTQIEKSIIKNSVKRNRPFLNLEEVHTFNSENIESYSFPSGHSATAFAIATIISLRYPEKKIIIPLFTWASLVAYARVYNGVHYPSDVIAGAILGSSTSFFIYKYQEEIFNTIENNLVKSFFMIPTKNGFMLEFSKDF